MNKVEAQLILDRIHHVLYEHEGDDGRADDITDLLARLATYCVAVLEGCTPDVNIFKKRD